MTIDAAVNFIRKLRHADKINLVGWSQAARARAAGPPCIPSAWRN